MAPLKAIEENKINSCQEFKISLEAYWMTARYIEKSNFIYRSIKGENRVNWSGSDVNPDKFTLTLVPLCQVSV
jgi:hypothetical protein